MRNHIYRLLIAGLAVTPLPASSEPSVAPSIALEVFMRDKYPKLWNHKAVAIGPAGTFAPGYRAANRAAAEQLAIERCEARLKWHPVRALRKAKCELYAVGDEIVYTNPPATSSTASATLRTIREPLASTARATVLFLPSCGRRAREQLDQGWRTTWFDLLALRGFEVIVPGTAGVTARCPRRSWLKDATVRTRRDLVRTLLTQMQRTHPKRSVFVWGDGEGAAVALTLNRQVDGIITTGYPCTYAGTRSVLISSNVPTLVIQGEKQSGLDVASRKAGIRDVEAFCASVLGGKQQRAIVIPGMKTQAPISRGPILETVSGFFAIAPPQLKPASPNKLTILGYEALLRFNRTYRLYRNHKAVVLGPNGTDYVAAGHDSTGEAIQAALFDCNRAQSGNGFVSTPTSVCVLFALDDEVVLPQMAEPRPVNATVQQPGEN